MRAHSGTKNLDCICVSSSSSSTTWFICRLSRFSAFPTTKIPKHFPDHHREQKSEKKDYVLKQSQEAMETLQVQMQDKDKKYAQLLQDKTNLEDSIIRDTIAKTQAEKSGKDPKAQGSVTKQIGDDLFRTASKEFSESPSKKESKKEVAVPDAKIIEDIQLKYKTEIDELKSHNDSLRKEIESKNEEVYAFQQEMTSQQEKQMADSIFFDKQIEEFRINTEVKTQELCEKDAIIETN